MAKVIKHCSDSAQLRVKFKQLINTAKTKLVETSGLDLSKVVIYPANFLLVEMPTILGARQISVSAELRTYNDKKFYNRWAVII